MSRSVFDLVSSFISNKQFQWAVEEKYLKGYSVNTGFPRVSNLDLLSTCYTLMVFF